jgi:hypothetical protein
MGPIATAGGFLIAQFGLRNRTGLSDSLWTFVQPYEAVDWLPHIVLLALGVSLIMYVAPTHRPRLIALAAALCLTAPARLLGGNLAQHWSIPGKLAVLVSLAALLGIVWLLLASHEAKQPAILRVSLLILVTVGTAIVMTQSGVLIYGLSSAALGAAIAGTAIVLVFHRGALNSAVSGSAAIVTFTLGSLIMLSHFFAELSTANAVWLLVSLTATSAPLPALLSGHPSWQRSMGRSICCLLPLGIAVASVVL